MDGKNEKQVGATELEDNEGFNEEQALQKVCLCILPRKKKELFYKKSSIPNNNAICRRFLFRLGKNHTTV